VVEGLGHGLVGLAWCMWLWVLRRWQCVHYKGMRSVWV